MATTIEDKIALFTKVLIERIEQDYAEKREKLTRYYENRKSELIKDYEQKIKNSVDTATRNTTVKKQQMISKAKSDMHLAVLKQRREFVERIIDEIKREALSFTETEEYAKFLDEAIKKVCSKFSSDQFVIFSFSPTDIKRHKDMILNTIKLSRSEDSFKIEETKGISGGVFAKTSDDSLEVDFTIDTIIEESRKLVGEILSSRLGEGWQNVESR